MAVLPCRPCVRRGGALCYVWLFASAVRPEGRPRRPVADLIPCVRPCLPREAGMWAVLKGRLAAAFEGPERSPVPARPSVLRGSTRGTAGAGTAQARRKAPCKPGTEVSMCTGGCSF